MIWIQQTKHYTIHISFDWICFVKDENLQLYEIKKLGKNNWIDIYVFSAFKQQFDRYFEWIFYTNNNWYIIKYLKEKF